MKKKLYFINIALVLVLMVGMFSGCGSKKIKMATNAEFAPFEYLEGGKVVGFDVEIAKKIAAKVGKELEIENMNFTGLITACQNKQVDFVIAGMTVKPDRAEKVNFSTPYFNASQVIVVKKDNEEIKEPKDIVNKKVGIALGYSAEDAIKAIGEVTLETFDNASGAIMALGKGDIDAVVLDAEPAKNYVKTNENIKMLEHELTKEEYAVAVNKENTELLEKINEVIKEMKENGEYDKLYAKYFGEKKAE